MPSFAVVAVSETRWKTGAVAGKSVPTPTALRTPFSEMTPVVGAGVAGVGEAGDAGGVVTFGTVTVPPLPALEPLVRFAVPPDDFDGVEEPELLLVAPAVGVCEANGSFEAKRWK